MICLTLRPVDVELAGYRLLAAALSMPSLDRLFQGQRRKCHLRFVPFQHWRLVVLSGVGGLVGAGLMVSPDK